MSPPNIFSQFYYRSKSAILEVPERFSSPSPDRLAFLTSDESQEARGSSNETAEGVDSFPNTFLASSENGFVMSQSGEMPWTCTVPGGLGALEWTDDKRRVGDCR
jgi:hypothetical protein